MLLMQLDMPSARYVCCANEGFISYRIDAQRQYIEFEQSENISNSSFVNIFHESEYIDRRKNESKNRRIFSFYACSFCCYKGLGSAHTAFVRTNAMLALLWKCKFSAKDITLLLSFTFCFAKHTTFFWKYSVLHFWKFFHKEYQIDKLEFDEIKRCLCYI